MSDIHLDGIAVLWWPVIWVWRAIFAWFTPAYWGFAWKVWNMNIPGFVWLIGTIVTVLAAIIYVILTIVAVILALIFSIIIAFVWLLAAIANGIFHFDYRLLSHIFMAIPFSKYLFHFCYF